MTSIQGTNTDFYSISNNWLYLNTSPADRDYLTNLPVSVYNFYGVNEPDLVSINKRKEILNKYDRTQNTISNLQDKYGNMNSSLDRKITIMDLLDKLNKDYNYDLTDYIKLLKETKYESIIKNNYNGTTLFVFKNGNEPLIHQWLNELKPYDWNKPRDTLPYNDRYLRELLKYHTLKFRLYPNQLVNKKVDLGTLLSDSISSTYNKIQIESINGYLYINLNKEYDLNEGGLGYYPDKLNRIKVEKVVECDEGIIYIIDKVLLPTIF
jgi:uncharacterized surface protein with fasciclin (FAS1) repeats